MTYNSLKEVTKMEHNEMLGLKIKQARLTKNITQEVLGKIINVDKQTISKIEKGKRTISAEEYIKIRDFLETTEEFLFDFDEFIYNPEDKTIKFEISSNLDNIPPKYKEVEIKDVVNFLKKVFKSKKHIKVEITDIGESLNMVLDLSDVHFHLNVVNEYLLKKGLTKKEIDKIWEKTSERYIKK